MLKVGRLISAMAGTFALTGQAASFALTRRLTAAYGSFALAGQSPDLDYSGSGNYLMTAVSGSFTLTGQAVLWKTYLLGVNNTSTTARLIGANPAAAPLLGANPGAARLRRS